MVETINNGDKMKERVLTGLAIFLLVAAVFLTKIVIGTSIVFDIFIAILAVFCAYETAILLKKQNKVNHMPLIAAFPLCLFAAIFLSFSLKLSAVISAVVCIGLFIVFVLIGFLITLLSRAKTELEMRERKIRTSKTSYAFSKAMNNVLGFLYPSVLIMLIVPLNHLVDINYIFADAIPYTHTFSVLMLAFCFLVPFICDTFAYLVGKTFGGKKLCPKISPNKTISGAIGGSIMTVLLLIVLYLILASIPSLQPALAAINLEWWTVALVGLIGSLACQAGDLFESHLKRKADVKDSGNILPGHGGVLDRLDGFIFVVPVIAFVTFLLVLL